ncbi:MAG TPA: wax ester/triacylglycerol synthase family O-acyltransferase [Casimicrobiaceae bacterium]|nr:wax ester/triacylglycerol synthase family O-acyltransferase [Casimicrobiaceae bacterium]
MADKKRESMSSVDVAWLRMDRPSNLMVICGVLLLRERIAIAALRRTIRSRFLRFARFRQRPVPTLTGFEWQTDEHFDLAHHVAPVALPRDAGDPELEALVSKLVSTPLAADRPLWQFLLVAGYKGGSAVVLRIHHCYADGIALIQVLLSMTDAEPSGEGAAISPPPRANRRSAEDDPLSQLIAPLAGALDMASKAGSTLLDKGAAMLRDPARALALAEQGGALTAELARLALMGEDSRTRFKGKPGVAKRVAWADPIPLDEVKAIGKALGSSVNDVLLASACGALRAYLVGRCEPVDGVVVRALVPVNLRPPREGHRLGNKFGLVFLDLPIGIANPVERLYAVRANMRSLKGSYQPVIALGILAAMGAGPHVLQERLLALLAKNATAVMTNVPGPREPLYLAGARIDRLMFWVPQSGDIGMGVSIMTYAGQVQFGLITDRSLCPDPQRVIRSFAPEFEKLALATLMAPWPWREPPAAAELEQAALA